MADGGRKYTPEGENTVRLMGGDGKNRAFNPPRNDIFMFRGEIKRCFLLTMRGDVSAVGVVSVDSGRTQ